MEINSNFSCCTSGFSSVFFFLLAENNELKKQLQSSGKMFRVQPLSGNVPHVCSITGKTENITNGGAVATLMVLCVKFR